jgi:hypothetical protein
LCVWVAREEEGKAEAENKYLKVRTNKLSNIYLKKLKSRAASGVRLSNNIKKL